MSQKSDGNNSYNSYNSYNTSEYEMLKMSQNNFETNKCRVDTCSNSSINIDVDSIKFIGKILNVKLLECITPYIEYKGGKCCFMCLEHLIIVIKQNMLRQMSKHEFNIRKNVVVILLRVLGVDEDYICSVKLAEPKLY
jgi:hypothetical protein